SWNNTIFKETIESRRWEEETLREFKKKHNYRESAY
ncbi:hypothetical protein TNCT_61231, partial [Trichonephila clavata]